MVSYTEAGSPERMIIDGGEAPSYLIGGRSGMESDPEAGSPGRGSALDRVRGCLSTSRSASWGRNRPMVMGWVQPPHKIHLGAGQAPYSRSQTLRI
jgi:hypothetical protein